MKAILIKLLVIFIVAVIYGTVVGFLFSIWFYGFITRHMFAEVYLSDTPEKLRFRFWVAFAVGAVVGIVWSYKVVKDMEL